MRRVVATDVQ